VHYNASKFYQELRDRSMDRLLLVTGITFGLVFVLYEVTAIGGYLSFGNSVTSDILNEYDRDDPAAIVARVALSLIVISCYPLAFNSNRASLISLLPTRWADRVRTPALPLQGGAAGGDSSSPLLLESQSSHGSTASSTGASSFESTPAGGADYELALSQPSGGAHSSINAAAAADGAMMVIGIDMPGTTSTASPTPSPSLSVRKHRASGAGRSGADGDADADADGEGEHEGARLLMASAAASASLLRTLPSAPLCVRLHADWPHAVATLCLVVLSVVVGLAFDNIGVVLSYKGALAGTQIVYIIPVAMYFSLVQQQRLGLRKAAAKGSDAPLDDHAFGPHGGSHGLGDALLEGKVHSPASFRKIWSLSALFTTVHGLLFVCVTLFALFVAVVGTLSASKAI
jgi:hypothetical protein